jgi:hypothetical protein
MNKNIRIDMDEIIQKELQDVRGKHWPKGKQASGPRGADAHFSIDESQLTLAEIGRGQVEILLNLRTDSETIRTIENIEMENEVLDRIIWPKKTKQ